MDPDEALKNLRELAQEGRAGSDWELYFEALDEWLSRGGFLPSAWDPNARDAKLREAAQAATRDVLGPS